MIDLQERVRQQEQTIEALLARIRDLEGQGDLERLAWLNLTSREREVMALLMRREMVTRAQIHTLLYGDRSDGGPDPKIIDVFICKIRRKLQGTSIEIETMWGVGYKLTAASRALLKSGNGVRDHEHAC